MRRTLDVLSETIETEPEMILSRLPIFLLLPGLTFVRHVHGQATGSSDVKAKTFEVVSIRPHTSEGSGGISGLPNGEHYVGTTVEILIEGAFEAFNNAQLIGIPAWAKSDRYDVETRVDDETAEKWKSLTNKERRKQQRDMMQAMLAERCKLKVHFESKELAVYDLVIAKGGLKMKESAPNEESSERVGNGTVSGRAIQMRNFLHAIPSDGRLIEDKTGLADRKFDFDLKWSPDDRPADTDSGPTLFTALEEQLGLKLVSAKSPETVVVVDHLEKPTPN